MTDKKDEAAELVAMSIELIQQILSKQMTAVLEEFNAEVDKNARAHRVIRLQDDYLNMIRAWMNRRGVLEEFVKEYPNMLEVLRPKKRSARTQHEARKP